MDSGDLGMGNRGYISALHHDQRAWDFDGHQRDDQVNLKFVHDGAAGKLTFYADWQNKVEPNEDATSFGSQHTAAAAGFTPYTRPFYYPKIATCSSSLTGGPGTPPVAQGNNFSNCFSAAQRTDVLAYLKFDWKIVEDLTWSNTAYYHYNYGRGIVAGPINQAGLPGLFGSYFPQLVVGSTTSAATLTNISNLFGGTGNEVRTTEYRINRAGLVSTANWKLGDHQIEGGAWIEHNEPAQHRVWYPFSAANNDLDPYSTPKGNSVFIQYFPEFYVTDVQFHIQDQWRIRPDLLLQFGDKASLQNADGEFRINQKNLPTAAVPVVFPSGKIRSNEWFLPQVGVLWDATDHEQVFVNIQKNLRQFIPYGAGSNFYGFSPWSLGTQAAFELFKQTVKPEHSWTYEAGARTHRILDSGTLVTALDGQVSVYHVDFSNRLLNIAPFNFINPAPAILANVGGVTTNGIDLAATLEFGPHWRLYNAVSYNKSTYNSDYFSGTTVVNGVSTPVTVATGGKWVPLTPDWLNKTILSTRWGGFEAQLTGDYIGRRYVTYLNDLSVKSTFMWGLEASYRFDLQPGSPLKGLRISANITNLNDIKGVSTAVVTSNSGGKFSGKAYETSGGLHGVGVSVVNALSERVEVTAWKDGFEWRQAFTRGKPLGGIEKLGATRKHGTAIAFTPDPVIFGDNVAFKPARLYRMARSKAYLFGGVEIRWSCDPSRIHDQTPAEATFRFPNGLADFLAERIKDIETVTPQPFAGRWERPGETGKVEWAIAWTPAGFGEADSFMQSYCNTVPTPEGGTHEAGLRAALTRGLKAYAELTGEKRGGLITADDVLAQAGALVSVFVANPEFQGQTKERLSSSDAQRLVETALRDPFDGGSAKQARDRKTQAILPLRGKILNVASATLDKLGQNKELTDLLLALGVQGGSKFREEDLRYERVVIMTDADVDGAHIASLLITFFYRTMPEMIRSGRLYLALPPLYRLSHGAKSMYARDDAHRDLLLETEFKGKKPEISRFKGLGEMMPAQLKETTMDPSKRTLARVTLPRAEELVEELVENLMGRKPESRFRFIQENAEFAVADLDI